MKKKFCLLIIISFLSLIIYFNAAVSAASEKINLIESVFVQQINSENFLEKLQNLEGLTYQTGSRGAGVLEFQNLLIANGYTSIGKSDGRYGKKTNAAVKEFQASANLPVTGNADLVTQFLLVLRDNSLIRNGNIYTAKKNNFVINFWPERAFYVGAVDETGNFIAGTYYYSTSDYYSGEYNNNLRHGKGTAHFANGDLYVGQWKNDAMNGEGTYYYGGINSSEYYKGNMTDNKMNGQGVYYLRGNKITGKWSYNKHVERKN